MIDFLTIGIILGLSAGIATGPPFHPLFSRLAALSLCCYFFNDGANLL